MPQVINIPRWQAKALSETPKDCIWISISEPQIDNSIVHNPAFNQTPQLKIAFWDITQPIPAIGKDEMLYPPTERDAQAIVDFLLKHEGKDVIVNCAAGISRSGATAQFCEECLGYEWDAEGKRRAMPNPVLMNLMRRYYMDIKFDGKPLLSALEIAQLKNP